MRAGTVSYQVRSVDTPWGPRPFTDISVEVGGHVYGSRLHGALTSFEAQNYVEATVRRIAKEAVSS